MKMIEITDDMINEGWKDLAASLGIGAAVTAGAGAGLMKVKDYNHPDFTKDPTYQTYSQEELDKIRNPTSQEKSPKIDSVSKSTPKSNADQPKTVKTTKQAATVKLLTKQPSEKTLLDAAKKAGIKGTELAAFMAQAAHECQNFTRMVETNPRIKSYLKNKSLGNKNLNDAKRFIGRGYFQLTGRWNYNWMGKLLGDDFTSTWTNANKLSEPETAAKVAIMYWKKRVRPHVTDFTDIKQVTKRINSSLNGLDDRTNKYNKYVSSMNTTVANNTSTATAKSGS